ncbi:MAG: FkbM family methyltransferase [Nitriliruptorales bacterium]|nr:FkbM family methyltransferase [Nitriliruptorales bacterium]
MSQNGEDHLLLRAFEGQERGFFIDVGAFDGIHLSNTYVLEQLGWTGYCLEPAPDIFELLHRNRPGSICLPAAAGAARGETMLFRDPTRLLSSIDNENRTVANYEGAKPELGLDQDGVEPVAVPVTTVDDVLRKHAPPPTIDLISIDVAGGERQVLDGFDLTLHRPRVLVIAAASAAARTDLIDHLAKAGYTHCRDMASSLFFAREKALVLRLRWTPVRCLLPRNLHPFGERYTHPAQRTDRVVLGEDSVPLFVVESSVEGPA